MAGGDLSLCNTSQCMHETPGRVTPPAPASMPEPHSHVILPKCGVAVGLLHNVLDAAESGECIACIDDLLIVLPCNLVPRLRELLGKEVVLARIDGYRVAPRRSRAQGVGAR